MLTVATFAYGFLASFVMASFRRNARAARRHPTVLLLFGWTLLSFSAVLAPLLLGYAALRTLGVVTV